MATGRPQQTLSVNQQVPAISNNQRRAVVALAMARLETAAVKAKVVLIARQSMLIVLELLC